MNYLWDDDVNRTIGRKVVTGTLAIAMTASLVPVAPAYADPEEPPRQEQGVDGSAGEDPADGSGVTGGSDDTGSGSNDSDSSKQSDGQTPGESGNGGSATDNAGSGTSGNDKPSSGQSERTGGNGNSNSSSSSASNTGNGSSQNGNAGSASSNKNGEEQKPNAPTVLKAPEPGNEGGATQGAPTVMGVKLGDQDVSPNTNTGTLVTNVRDLGQLTITVSGNLGSGSKATVNGSEYSLVQKQDGTDEYVLQDAPTLADGTYTFVVSLASGSEGGTSTSWTSQSVQIDTAAPTASISWDVEGNPSAVHGGLYATQREARVTVTDDRKVQGSPTLSLPSGASQDGGWSFSDDGKSATAIIVFGDGTYESNSVQVSATDGLNALSNGVASGFGDSFTVDTQAPMVTKADVIGKAGTVGAAGETLNFAGTISSQTNPLYVRNKTVSLHVDDANGVASVEAKPADGDAYRVEDRGEGNYTFELPDGSNPAITIAAADRAGHTSNVVTIPAGRLVADNAAPTIDSVKVGDHDLASDDRLGIRKNQITVNLSDQNLLDGTDALKVQATPEGETSRTIDVTAAQEAGTYTFTLPDGTYSSIVLTATDKAGNSKDQTLNNVMVDTKAPTFAIDEENVDQAGKSPLRYDGDSTAYLGYGHKVTFTVSEANFTPENIGQYMKVTNDGKEVAVTWNKNQDGTFTGTPAQDGTTDGVYEFAISGKDPAGNQAVPATEGGKSKTDRFVVDMTAPEVTATDVTQGMRQGSGWNDESVYDYLSQTGDKARSGIAQDYFNKDTTSLITVKDVNLYEKNSHILIDGQRVQLPDGSAVKWGDTQKVSDSLTLKWTKVDDSTYACLATYTDDHKGGDDHTVPYVIAFDKADNSGSVGDQAKQRPFVVDETNPAISLDWGSDPQVKNTQNDRDYYNAGRSVTTTITDGNWDLSQGTNDVIHVTDKDAGENPQSSWSVTPSSDNGGSDSFSYTTRFGDGDYNFWTEAHDLAGNHSEDKSTRDFAVDTKAPAVSVSFDNNGARNGKYFDGPRTMTVKVVERNFDATRFHINVTTSNSDHNNDPNGDINDASKWADSGDTHTFTYLFDRDGAYTVSVSGSDLATNEAVANPDDKDEGRLSVDEFVIDQTPAEVEVKPTRDPDVTFDGVPYWRHPVDWTVTIKDRNLDVETANKTVANVTNGRYAPQDLDDWDKWIQSRADDGNVTWTRTISYDELASNQAGQQSKSLDIHAVDLAGNTTDVAKTPFYVDRTAPSIVMVNADRSPSQTADPSEGQYQFYNQATSMTMNFHDPYRLESAVVCDPDGQYEVSNGVSRGATDGSIRISLVDGTQSGANTEYERNITLTVTDIAGNVRIWTIDRQGNVVDDVSSSRDNVSINNLGIYPNRLIEDITAPIIALSGVTPGTCYNSDQTLHAAVDEFNFHYLRRFDGSRSVVHVTKQEGAAGRAESSWDVPASALTGSGSNWAFDQVFDQDGHYTLTGHFFDYANNESNTATIGEFTIDKTAPVVTVDWDNNDVRNGKYYSATRTAIITVVEHNFGPSLFSIDTTGSVGGWSTSGDTHTCTVFFDEGVHDFSVSGKDLAGNESNVVTEPEFVVDTTDPTIEFGGVAERMGYSGADASYEGALEDHNAYNGVVAPQIAFADEANFDASSVSFTLTGGKLGDATNNYTHNASEAGNGETVQYADFGKNDSDAETTYDVNADDVYVLHASVADLAGNTAEGDITFSVNRFGSNYLITMNGQEEDPDDNALLTDAPTIQVREINVSGAASEMDHDVIKEYANATSSIARDDSGDDTGYSLETPAAGDAENTYGWAEYLYTVKSGNFGEGSDSDHGDGGQGVYRVNVASNDSASNANTTANYWQSGLDRSEAEAQKGTTQFTLDQVAPVIDDVQLPGLVSLVAPGSEYQASFHVTDVITTSDDVQVTIDGEPVQDLQGPDGGGEGTYTFTIPARSLAARNIDITVTDYAGRSAHESAGRRFVTNLIPEACAVAAVLGATGGVVYYRRRKGKDAPKKSDNPYEK